MAGTPQTIAVLLDQVQNVVATLKARTGNGKINLVTAPEYGADPTGVADSTAAFAAALAGPSTAIVPPGVYRLSNLVMPSGSSLVGYSALGYGKGTGLSVATTLVALNASAARMINVDGASDVLIAGLRIDCDPTRSETRNTNCDGISAGGKNMTLRDVTIRLGRYGLGGAVSSGTNIAASMITTMQNCQFFDCVTGIGDLIDAWLTNCFLSYCTTGAYFTSLSGSINMTACRIEWNTGDGLHVDNNADLMFVGCFFDRNYVSGAYLNGTYKAIFSGCEFKRNGRNLDGNSCHVRLNSVSEVTFTGCSSRKGRDDDNTGNESPAVWVREMGSSWNVSFVGNDLVGVTGTIPMALSQFWTGNLPTYYGFVNNSGLRLDERSGYSPVNVSGYSYHQYNETNLVQSASAAIPLYHDPIAAYSGVTHKLRVTVRNQTTGQMVSSEFNYLIQREGGAPTITQSAAMGTIGTAGYIGFGSGTIVLYWTSIAADASSYSLGIQNTSATNIHYVTAQFF